MPPTSLGTETEILSGYCIGGTGFGTFSTGIYGRYSNTTMMPSNRFHIVDVFAPDKYAGNQLAVFHDSSNISDHTKQRLAREMNFSEVTFIESLEPRDGGYDVRIFDPIEELAFAGHPTLGTAHVLRKFIRDDDPDELNLNLDIGQIPVTVDDGGDEEIYWMEQISPSFDRTFEPDIFVRMLGISRQNINEEYPIQTISTGLPTVIVPINSINAVRGIQIDQDIYYNELIEPFGGHNLLCFTPETATGSNDVHVRVFAEYADVPEDPATGSSNGCLAAYLVEHGFFDSESIDISAEQGIEMGRPAKLYLQAERFEDDISIRVGGAVESVAEGHLL